MSAVKARKDEIFSITGNLIEARRANGVSKMAERLLTEAGNFTLLQCFIYWDRQWSRLLGLLSVLDVVCAESLSESDTWRREFMETVLVASERSTLELCYINLMQ